MNNKILIIGISLLGILLLGSAVVAAPTVNRLGTYASTTILSTTQLCLTGDLPCKSTWPTGGGGTGTVSTSTNETKGRIPYWTSTAGTPALLGEIATTTLTASLPLSLSQAISVIGSSASVLSLSTAGDWTGTFDGQEGTYYLNASNLTNFGVPFYTFFSATTTDALSVGSINKYYTDALARAAFSSTATGLTYTSASGIFSLTTGYTIPLTTTLNLLTFNPFTASYYVGTSTATSTFVGGVKMDILNTSSTTASSTMANGINLSTGCFAIGGTCISGGTPGGSDTQVQFNDGGSFGGDTNFTWSSSTQTLNVGNNGGIIQNTGDVQLTIKNSGGDGYGVTILGSPGLTTNSGGGNIQLIAGSGVGSGGTGGDIFISPGQGTNGQANGKIYIEDGGSGLSGILDTSLITTSNKTFTFPNVSGTFGVGVSTTSPNLAYWGSDAGLYSVATTTLTGTYPISVSNSPVVLGSSGATITFPATSTLYGTGSYGNFLMWTTQPTWTATSTLTRLPNLTDVGTLTTGALGTGFTAVNVAQGGTGQTTFTSSQLLYGNGTNGLSSVATGTISASGGVTVTAGRSTIGGSTAIACTAASSGVTGCLTGTDWDTFNGKGAGTVTSIVAGAGLLGGTITTSGTLYGQVGTSSIPTINPAGVAFWTAVGSAVAPAKLGSVATSSVTCTTPLSCTSFDVLTGGGAITLGTVTVAKGGTNSTSFPINSIITSDSAGTSLIATGTQLTIGNLLATSTTATSTIYNRLEIGSSTPSLARGFLAITGNEASYIQANIQNKNTGTDASSVWVATANNGNDTTYYGEWGINNSRYSTAAFNSQNGGDVFMHAKDGGLVIGTASSTNTLADLRFITGGTASTSIRMSINNLGYAMMGTTTNTKMGSFTIASSTLAQLSLSADAGVNQWAIRNAGGNFYLATTTVVGTATTSTSALSIISSSGFTGINSSIPSAMLDVHGGGLTTGVTAQFSNVSGTANMTILDSGAVGIGTTTPYTSLTIYTSGSTAATSPQLVFSASSTVAGLGNFLNNWSIGTDLADKGKFKIASSSVIGTNDRFVIDGNGYIGIGTSSPYAKLSVVGETVAQYFTATSSLEGIEIGTKSLWFGNPGTYPSIGFSTSGRTGNWVNKYSAGGGDNWIIEGANDGVGFNLYYGNGLGLWNATSTLSIYGGSNPPHTVFNENGLNWDFRIEGDTINNLFFVDASADNVGIGTTAPGGLLDVRGRFSMFGSTQGYLYFDENEMNSGYSTNAEFTSYINWDGYQAGTTQYRNLNIANGKEGSVLYIQGSSGNVGIGTTTPQRKLTITNAGANGQLLLTDTGAVADNHYGEIGFSQGAFSINTMTDALATTSRMFISNAGNVGIGTTSPYAKLSVVGQTVSGYFTATTTTVSTFPNASTTNLSIDATGKLYIPNATDPAVAAIGQIAINSTAASSSLRFYDGTAERALYPDSTKTFTVASTSLMTGTTTIPLGFASRAQTWTRSICKTDIGTAVFQFGDGSASSTSQALSTTKNNAVQTKAFTIYQDIYLAIGNLATSPNYVTCTITVRQDPD